MFAIRRTTLILLVTLVAGTASVSLNTAIAPSSPPPGHLVVQNDRDLAGGCSQGLTVSYKPKTVDTAFAVKFTTDASNCTVSVLYHTLVTALDPIGPAAVQGAMERNRASIVTAYLNTAVWTFPPTQVCPRTEYSDEEGVNVPNTLDHHFHEVRTEREFPPYCESKWHAMWRVNEEDWTVDDVVDVYADSNRVANCHFDSIRRGGNPPVDGEELCTLQVEPLDPEELLDLINDDDIWTEIDRVESLTTGDILLPGR